MARFKCTNSSELKRGRIRIINATKPTLNRISEQKSRRRLKLNARHPNPIHGISHFNYAAETKSEK